MGLAAANVGWKVKKGERWKSLKQIRNFRHLDASSQSKHRTFRENLRFRILVTVQGGTKSDNLRGMDEKHLRLIPGIGAGEVAL